MDTSDWDSDDTHSHIPWKQIRLKAPALGSKRWKKRQRRIRQGKFKEYYNDNNRISYTHEPISDNTDEESHGLNDPSPDRHDNFQVRETDFAETFLFRMTIGTPWRQLPAGECHTLSIPSMASADSLSRQRSGVNLPEQMPPELFDGVLFFLDEKRSVGGPRPNYFRTLRRYQQADCKEDDLLGGLRAGSLVCRYWANSCRRSIFSGSLLCIDSSDDADIFLKYAREGCSSLDPLHMLIDGLSVRQGYNTDNSFVHRLHCITQLKGIHDLFGLMLNKLTLYGPIPERFPRHNLATPHWSIPPAVITPPSLLAYRRIDVSNIHFPSSKHVMKYVTHLICTKEEVNAEKLTWDESAVTPVSIPLARLAKKLRRLSMVHYGVRITARGCTDNLRLCLYTALARPDCPLHWLPDAGRMLRAIMSLWELDPASDRSTQECYLCWDCNLSVPAQYVQLSIFFRNTIEDRNLYDSNNADSESDSKDLKDTHLAFNLIFAIQRMDRAPPALHLVGRHIEISESDTTLDLINKLALFTEYSAAPLVCIEITFEDYEKLKTWVWAHLASINVPPPNIYMCILMYWRRNNDSVFPHIPQARDDGEGDFLRIDPISLEPVGPAWENPWDMKEAIYKEIYSL